MNRWLAVGFTVFVFMLLVTTAVGEDLTKNPDFILEEKIRQSVQDEFKPPEVGFFYRYDGNPIYEHANEYLIIDDGKIRYVSYDPELFNQISALVEDGDKDESDIRKKLKRIDISAEYKSCPKVDSMLADLYQSALTQVAAEKYPQEPGIKLGGSFEYQLYFSNWKGNRFVYEFEGRTSPLNKKTHVLVDYVRSCGSETKS